MPVNRRLAPRPGILLSLLPAALLVAACSSTSPTTVPSAPASAGTSVSSQSPAQSPARSPAGSSRGASGGPPIVVLAPTPVVSETPEPSTGSRTAAGDVPDNAVFLTYRDNAHHVSIQYVEGWQVAPQPDGVTIADKDSSEKVQVVAGADAATYVATVDLPRLQAQPGFNLIKQDRVKVKGQTYDHLQYHAPSDADPVTGKQVPSTVDRYYVPGSGQMAIVTLSTPDGVDNVDAFRQMIESFTWR